MHTSKLALKVFHLKMTQFSSENCGLISRRILAKNEETSPEKKEDTFAINPICLRKKKKKEKERSCICSIHSSECVMMGISTRGSRCFVLIHLTVCQGHRDWKQNHAEEAYPSLPHFPLKNNSWRLLKELKPPLPFLYRAQRISPGLALNT